eukprot:GHUV01015735.1.p1 GENE.GHUV01015735.1~~GHUV01015735.1.p1  ORF type:complete len:344 (+),score=114.46 GHUV01015735.1:317-1348(+)
MEEQYGALQAARTRYLEQQCLLQELEQLVTDAQYALKHADGSSTDLSDASAMAAADGRLQRAGLDFTAEALASLTQHLQAAYAAQRVQLPSPAPRPATPLADATNKQGFEQAVGSKQHILGVTPAELKTQHMPSRRAAQKSHMPILPCLERRLQQRALKSIQAVAGPAAGPEAGVHVISMIASKQSRVVKLRADGMECLSAYIQMAQAYAQELDDMKQILMELLSKCILVEQPRLDKDHREFLTEHLNNLTSKLQVMQLQVRTNTYTKDTVPALRVIQDALEQLQQDTSEAIDGINAKLHVYAQLPPKFEEVLQRYRKIQVESKNLDGVLQNLQAVEEDCAYY